MIQGKTLTLMVILCVSSIAGSPMRPLDDDAGGPLGGLLGGGDSGLGGLVKKLLQALGLAPKDPAPSVPGVPLPLPSGLPSVPAAPSLPAGVPSLPAGVPSVPAGVPSVPSGVPSLPAGVPSVPAGVPSLPAGIPSVPAGVPSVPAGVPSLPAGVPSVPAGVPSVPAAPLPAVPAAPASPLSGLLSGLPLGDQAALETADLVEQVQMILDNLFGVDGRSLGPVKGVKSFRNSPKSGATALGGLLGDAESGLRLRDQAIETADLVEQVQMILEKVVGKDGRSLGPVKGVKSFRTSKSGATALGGALGGLLGGEGLLG